MNSPGVVDSDFRGEVHAVIHNSSAEAYTFSEGDRVAQLVIMHHLMPDLVVMKELTPSERGEDGFGSTGGFAGRR